MVRRLLDLVLQIHMIFQGMKKSLLFEVILINFLFCSLQAQKYDEINMEENFWSCKDLKLNCGKLVKLIKNQVLPRSSGFQIICHK